MEVPGSFLRSCYRLQHLTKSQLTVSLTTLGGIARNHGEKTSSPASSDLDSVVRRRFSLQLIYPLGLLLLLLLQWPKLPLLLFLLAHINRKSVQATTLEVIRPSQSKSELIQIKEEQ